MNEQRRKALTALQGRIEALETEDAREALGALIDELQGIKNDIESQRDDEQKYYDEMPEGLQSGEKGERAQAAVDNLESAMNTIETVMDPISAALYALESIQGDCDEVSDYLGQAQD